MRETILLAQSVAGKTSGLLRNNLRRHIAAFFLTNGFDALL